MIAIALILLGIADYLMSSFNVAWWIYVIIGVIAALELMVRLGKAVIDEFLGMTDLM